jgi:type 1 glutamine amidotransferase
MREALIVWGGWNGHEPEQCAGIVARMLEEDEFQVRLETETRAFTDPDLSRFSLIVPIYTMSKIEKDEVANLSRAVRGAWALRAFMAAWGTPFARRSSTSSCAAANGSPIPAISSTIA